MPAYPRLCLCHRKGKTRADVVVGPPAAGRGQAIACCLELLFLAFAVCIVLLPLSLAAAASSPGGHTTVTPVIGIYRVPATPAAPAAAMAKAGINAVFIPHNPQAIRWYRSQGFKVFVSVNIFGGTAAWRSHPDARPCKTDGHLLGHGGGGRITGVCPTHPAVRAERMQEILALLGEAAVASGGGSAPPVAAAAQSAGDDAAGGQRSPTAGELDTVPDGIWLDFIRYPACWEESTLAAPDTCYCRRCPEKFRDEAGVYGIPLQRPLGLVATVSWRCRSHTGRRRVCRCRRAAVYPDALYLLERRPCRCRCGQSGQGA